MGWRGAFKVWRRRHLISFSRDGADIRQNKSMPEADDADAAESTNCNPPAKGNAT